VDIHAHDVLLPQPAPQHCHALIGPRRSEGPGKCIPVFVSSTVPIGWQSVTLNFSRGRGANYNEGCGNSGRAISSDTAAAASRPSAPCSAVPVLFEGRPVTQPEHSSGARGAGGRMLRVLI